MEIEDDQKQWNTVHCILSINIYNTNQNWWSFNPLQQGNTPCKIRKFSKTHPFSFPLIYPNIQTSRLPTTHPPISFTHNHTPHLPTHLRPNMVSTYPLSRQLATTAAVNLYTNRQNRNIGKDNKLYLITFALSKRLKEGKSNRNYNHYLYEQWSRVSEKECEDKPEF